jgi:hypothetical protein
MNNRGFPNEDLSSARKMSGNFDLNFEDIDILSMLDSDDEFLIEYLKQEVPQQSVETNTSDNNEGKPREGLCNHKIILLKTIL